MRRVCRVVFCAVVVVCGVPGLSVVKSFDQKDFTKFATDPNLSASDLILNANQGVSVHPAGYIQSTSFSQKVLLVNTPPAQHGQVPPPPHSFSPQFP
jgi:hypothetical protein